MPPAVRPGVSTSPREREQRGPRTSADAVRAAGEEAVRRSRRHQSLQKYSTAASLPAGGWPTFGRRPSRRLDAGIRGRAVPARGRSTRTTRRRIPASARSRMLASSRGASIAATTTRWRPADFDGELAAGPRASVAGDAAIGAAAPLRRAWSATAPAFPRASLPRSSARCRRRRRGAPGARLTAMRSVRGSDRVPPRRARGLAPAVLADTQTRTRPRPGSGTAPALAARPFGLWRRSKSREPQPSWRCEHCRRSFPI